MATRRVELSDLIALHGALYEIPQTFDPMMRVPARLFLNKSLLNDVLVDQSLMQLVHVAALPGIVRAAYAMPDIHQGYGFPIGGVAATDIATGGIISPGGIGYDINCGVRLLRLSCAAADITVRDRNELATALNEAIPSGVGRGGYYTLSEAEMDAVLQGGADYLVYTRGMGTQDDLLYCEEQGRLTTAIPEQVSVFAKKRGADQLGTLGSGNHFLEVQRVAEIYDTAAAAIFGLQEDQVTIMIHCGSRGLGHQICTDHVQQMVGRLPEWGIVLADRELACAPFTAPEGQAYFGAMGAAANFAWANRQAITHGVRTAVRDTLGRTVAVETVYDVCHNIGKRETHTVDGSLRELLVHRKGATRAFPAGHAAVPVPYRSVGHPVLVPGTMGTASYILVGTDGGMDEAFGSSCHGAGRCMSRAQARGRVRGHALRHHLESRGIVVRCRSESELAEEAPLAYKNVDEVIQVIEHADIARRVARVEPIAVIKGN